VQDVLKPAQLMDEWDVVAVIKEIQLLHGNGGHDSVGYTLCETRCFPTRWLTRCRVHGAGVQAGVAGVAVEAAVR
jgi:hypothetical protein